MKDVGGWARRKQAEGAKDYEPPSELRTKAMAAARKSGMTLDRIGEMWGLSRERVRQILQQPDPSGR